MSVQPTYPGVYVQEVPSGVRTIVGVSTSVTAFVGKAKKGPINKAILVFSYSEFERKFGGLDTDSELSYAVRSFFLNGGSQAVIVRLAKEAVEASLPLFDGTPEPSLTLAALEKGFSGNYIEVQVDHQAVNPDSHFNLTLNYLPPDNPSGGRSEAYSNLSMNSAHPRFVEKLVNGVSELVSVERTTPASTLTGLGPGEAFSGELADVATLLDDTHNSFRLSINGTEPVNVQINIPGDIGGANADLRLDSLCGAIQSAVLSQAGVNPVLVGFTCTRDNNRIHMTSGTPGENSRVEVLPGIGNDAAARLKLGVANGGRQIDAVAYIRPVEVPDHATLTSGNLVDTDLTDGGGLPRGGNNSFKISLDSRVPDKVDIGTVPAAGADHQARMEDIAQRIQLKVRDLKPNVPAYRDFTCVQEDAGAGNRRFILSSGSSGASSSVMVTEVTGDGLASGLRLLAGIDGAVRTSANNVTLQGGNESPFTDAEAYNIYIGNRSNREGIYALESTDIFNILCLPGISDGSIIMDSESYCRERRAFMIVDSPRTDDKPSEIAATVAGTSLPKSDHAAIYYPWIKIGDPLNSGQLRTSAPCGAIAGLYARIDSSRGVWKAPAGTEASLAGVRGLDYPLTDGENGFLNPQGINCLRSFPATGSVVWGARTLAGSDERAHEYKYIPVRRTALFIEESLYRGLKWVVFEPNDEPLWAQIRLNVGAFMHNLFRQGAFQGITKQEAYFVKCDKETTTQNDINLGIVNIWVGFAPLKPAEFVIIHLQQMAGQIQV